MTPDSPQDLLAQPGAALGEVARLVAGNRRFAGAGTGTSVGAALQDVAPQTDDAAYDESPAR